LFSTLPLKKSENFNKEMQASVFPNPASSQAILSCNWEIQTELRVVNTMGEILIALELQSGFGQYELNIDSFPSGIYFLMLSNIQGTKVLRLVKSN
jgi:hypothetical protein